jgi:hypothetical protein
MSFQQYTQPIINSSSIKLLPQSQTNPSTMLNFIVPIYAQTTPGFGNTDLGNAIVSAASSNQQLPIKDIVNARLDPSGRKQKNVEKKRTF